VIDGQRDVFVVASNVERKWIKESKKKTQEISAEIPRGRMKYIRDGYKDIKEVSRELK
jgi:cold shock CspA family protein